MGILLLLAKKLTSVEFDDGLLLKEAREVFALWQRNDLALHTGNIHFDVRRNCGTFVVIFASHLLATIALSHADHVAYAKGVAGNVNDFAIDADVSVANHLSSLEDGLGIAQSPNGSGKSKFEQSQEVQTRVAVHSVSAVKGQSELLFQHVVVAPDDLLLKELITVFAGSLVFVVRAVLAVRVLSLVAWALCFAPNVKTDSSADVVFSSSISCHFYPN